MKTPVLLMLVALVGGLLAGCSTTPASTSPDLHLAAPQSSADREYLGLAPGATNFLLEEIRCEVLVIDCFDMYCHICQAGAGHVNDLYRMTQERGLGSRVKFIGLGLGDTPLEVATYKEKFKVPFPVFPDRKSTVAKQFGPARPPNLLVLRKQGDELQLVNSSPGLLLNPADVLSHIQTALGNVQSYFWNDPGQAAQTTCDPKSGSCRKLALPVRRVTGNGHPDQ